MLPIKRLKTDVVVPVSLKICNGVALDTMSNGDNHGLMAVGKAKIRKSLPNSAGLKIFFGKPPKMCLPKIIPTAAAAASAYNRSEERRVGKEGKTKRMEDHEKEK